MSLIKEYVADVYGDSELWFIDEVKKVHNQLRIHDILDKKEYLAGKHAILLRQTEQYNGKIYQPRRIVLQYAKTILNFQTNYLLGKPVTLSGEQEAVDTFNKIYRQAKYNQIDYDILDSIIKYGNAYEYIYLQDGIIKSKLIATADSYPVYDHENNMIAFIEFYTVDGIDYYTIYYNDHVEKYSNAGGEVRQTGVYNNLSGLPICYRNQNELDPCFGRSELEDIIPIIDNIEDIISKFSDSFYKYHNPIPVAIGQQMKGEGLDPTLVGGGIILDDNSDFKLVGTGLDYKSYESVYMALKQALLDISSTPAVSLNSQDVSNLSEVSIKLLFSLADVKASLNEKYMREGIEQRFSKIRKM